jgi:hypothetical protein
VSGLQELETSKWSQTLIVHHVWLQKPHSNLTRKEKTQQFNRWKDSTSSC